MDINNKELLLGHNQIEEDVEEQVADFFTYCIHVYESIKGLKNSDDRNVDIPSLLWSIC